MNQNSNKDEYEIVSKILSKSYGHESNELNGLGWMNDGQDYTSILLLNHTVLKDWDMKLIREYIERNQINEFDLIEFQIRNSWDINKIQGFSRYKIEELNKQNNHSQYIGLVQISNIVFAENKNNAIVYTSFLCAENGDCGIGQIFHLVKNNNWEIVKIEELWAA